MSVACQSRGKKSSRSNRINSRQKRLIYQSFDEQSEIFHKTGFHEKCGIFEACKKVSGFFDTPEKIRTR